MKPVSIAALATIIGIIGTWSGKKTLETPQVVGSGILMLFFVIMQESEPELARSFAWLYLATTVGAFGQDVATTVGNITTGKPVKKPDPTTGTAGGTAGTPTTNTSVGSGIGTGITLPKLIN